MAKKIGQVNVNNLPPRPQLDVASGGDTQPQPQSDQKNLAQQLSSFITGGAYDFAVRAPAELGKQGISTVLGDTESAQEASRKFNEIMYGQAQAPQNLGEEISRGVQGAPGEALREAAIAGATDAATLGAGPALRAAGKTLGKTLPGRVAKGTTRTLSRIPNMFMAGAVNRPRSKIVSEIERSLARQGGGNEAISGITQQLPPVLDLPREAVERQIMGSADEILAQGRQAYQKAAQQVDDALGNVGRNFNLRRIMDDTIDPLVDDLEQVGRNEQAEQVKNIKNRILQKNGEILSGKQMHSLKQSLDNTVVNTFDKAGTTVDEIAEAGNQARRMVSDEIRNTLHQIPEVGEMLDEEHFWIRLMEGITRTKSMSPSQAGIKFNPFQPGGGGNILFYPLSQAPEAMTTAARLTSGLRDMITGTANTASNIDPRAIRLINQLIRGGVTSSMDNNQQRQQ